MPLSPFALRDIADHVLLDGLLLLATRDRELEADLLVHLGEVDARELALARGYRSLHAYCMEVLHFSESAAFHRITAARAARRFPQILERIQAGELHLSGLRLLLPQMTAETCSELLDLARHQSKRAIEERLADRSPKPDAPARVCRLPDPTMAPTPLAPEATLLAPEGTASELTQIPTAGPVAARLAEARPMTRPLGEGRYRVQFTAGPALRAKLRDAQALLRHQIPDGDLARILERALDALLREARRTKFAMTDRPRAQVEVSSSAVSRYIPAAIRRAVASRDGERCTFVARDGRRCGARDALEYHHLVAFARSRRHLVSEITLRCRAHNAHAARRDFGAEYMERFRGERMSTVARPGASRAVDDPASP